MYNVQYTMYNVQCTIHNVQCLMYNVLHTGDTGGGGGAKVKMKVNQLILVYSVTARYVSARTPVIG